MASTDLTTDPAWPLPALAIIALLLAGLTVWTYLGVPRAGFRRVLTVLGLRLLALLLACLTVLRPSLAFREDLRLPSLLLIAQDASESMTIQDEFNQQSRWDALRQTLRKCEPVLQRLQDEQNVTVVWHRFAEDAGDLDPQGKPDGKRTDFGQMLYSLYQRHGQERHLRGLLILSDGADNGTRYPALTEAAKWRGLSCPIHTFALGQPTTTSKQHDIAFLSITPEPAPVPVKGKLTIKGILDAPGFENANVRLRLFIDDKEITAQNETLRKSAGNEVKIVTDAPIKPGEIKVTLKADPLPGEVTRVNNEISTYVTVVKEGVSVLLVAGKLRQEQTFIRRALSQDPCIRFYEAIRLTDAPVSVAEGDLFQFEKQHYDVIIVDDISAKRLSGGNLQILAKIHDLVRDKGTGLVMLGGEETFGEGDWRGTPIEDLLPVRLDATGQIREEVRMLPTDNGLRHYLLRLADREADNAALWQRLPKLEGMNVLGTPKDGATVLARANDSRSGAPMLVGQTYGQGRTLAFAGDTTWHWLNLGAPRTREGLVVHPRFWKQLVLWLAKQEEAEGSVWVKPDTRRLAAGSKLGFSVGLRGKGGVDLKGARFEVTVIGPPSGGRQPPGVESTVPTSRDQNDVRGTFWKTDMPGEYRLQVRGWGKDVDGQETSGDATARFLVYQDDAEMMRQAADHDFLAKLAHTSGGKAYRAEELPRFLQEVGTQPLPQSRPKTELWPDWRRSALSGFLPSFFVLFVIVLCLEWGLRRYWGLV